ncbi:MAG TPA: YebC/PmpR family DNA-binding transcriptional regulator [Planctomycetota bacterium]|nr:YebC/PmpR family DNA-binding transcriptional regulator [Planctomycetota bacterium]HRR79005.1 YebC/PmpR family DNA-binding transcriptional regulator [Planctomycetota bacterium]HRT93453.1 YebC/PmpR family DNA-binding transcriptional regulator [Planctomycetota bacterium]
MSGHSHWATIKHKKAATDAKKGKLFSKLAKDIIMAAQQGGGDPDANFSLRAAIDAAKAANVPKDNIERAIKRGTGELPGITYERLTYEGYGPHGVALLVDVVTDSRNRTASELRKIFSTRGGKMEGSVAWMFEAKGLITLPADAIAEDELMELVLNAGADDLVRSGDTYEITTSPQEFNRVKQALADRGLTPEVAELTRLPQQLIKLEGEAAQKVMNLLEELEDHDDVQNVYTNFDAQTEATAAK